MPSHATRSRLASFLPCLLALASCCFLPSCLIVPMRVPTRVKVPNEKNAKLDMVDASFIQPGLTQRAEIAERFRPFDTGIDLPEIYWARWAQSSWNVTYAVGGYAAATGGMKRIWMDRNLVVQFDGDGNVCSSKVVPNGELIPVLVAAAASRNPEPLETVDYLVAHGNLVRKADPAHLKLDAESLEFIEERDAAHSFKVPRSAILHIADVDPAPSEAGPDIELSFEIVFDVETAVGRKLRVVAPPVILYHVLRWIEQTRPQPPAEAAPKAP